MKAMTFALGLLASAGAAQAVAHHSFDGSFDRTKPTALTGTVSEFRFTDPHTYLKLTVREEDGTEVTWHVETTSARGLGARGWTPESIKVGEQLTVQGYPARDGHPYMRLETMRHADGSAIALWLPAPLRPV